MKLTMLGTGHAVVTECYNTCFALEEDGKYFLVDGGGGAGLLRQLKRAGLDWREMREIFVTHKHIDHLLGIIWMMRLFCHHIAAGRCREEVRIYGNGEVISILREMAGRLLTRLEAEQIGGKLRLIAVDDGERRTVNGREVTFFDIRSAKDRQFGFCMELDGGGRLTCCGDEPYHPCERPYAQGSRWLMHEAFCLHSQADVFKPYEKHHSTVKDACEAAEALGVQNLILYHTEDTDLPHRKERYLSEGRNYFSGNLYVPDDLETIRI